MRDTEIKNSDSNWLILKRTGTTLSLASLGFFFVLIGVIWIITPNLSQKIIHFFEDFKLKEEVFPNVSSFASHIRQSLLSSAG